MPNNVVSKYFSSEAVMDDSLCDFQEKKKYNTGPKNVKKTKNIKKPKRTRGQKDIRALIKKQENDVLSYSKNFDKVCKEAGVDVDSEELQLAIALSKSLDEVKKENKSDKETKITEHLTSQERTLNIKRTLQEYGFRIPKTKITETNKRKKFRKQYKLLLTTETERQQIISDKYSEVLAGNIFKSPVKVLEFDYSDKELYYKTTNIAYEHIKNDDVYYVKDLFDKTTHKSCLLRDWSEIPGRPLSPTVEVNSINFDDIICNQCELDCILSGTIFAAQQIVTNKNCEIAHNNSIIVDKANQFPPKPLENEIGYTSDCVSTLIKGNNILKETDCYTNSETMSVSEARCTSPDLFDDEVSAVMECPDNSVLLSVQTVSKTDNIHTYCMDLTECVGIDSSNSDIHTKTKLQANNEINITNRKSNDLMEMTECVSTGSKQTNFENIDLTQSSNDSFESCKQTIDNIISKHENIEVMDLTQVPDCNPLAVKMSNSKKDNCLDDTIILVNDDINLELQQQDKNLNLRELSEPICIEYLNKGENDSSIEIDKAQSHQIYSYKGDLYSKFYENSCDYEMSSLKNMEDVGECKNKLVKCQPDELDLTQSSNSSQGETLTNQPSSNYSTSLGKIDNVSIDYDEISDNIESESVTSLKSYECHRNQSNSIENEVNKIVSNPNKSLEGFEFSEKQSSYSVHQSKHKNIDFRCITITNDENDSPEKEASNLKYNEIATNNSNSLEVFEISDNEFNYSLHQSKHDNFDFRDVSVMNNFSNHENSYNIGTKNRSLSESNLQTKNISPCKEVSQSQKLNFNGETSKPMKMRKENIVENVLQTPKNGEYIIKTNEVTPMLDYASMSSPERHKELEKYGLKPFKRKRAIQLLTHLYNQTHPIIESLKDDDCPSPSKRLKKDDGDEKCYIDIHPLNSLKKLSEIGPLDFISKTSTIVPIKSIESIPEGNKENDLYAITNDQPDIRNMECDPEDWFFQKREKAKLHSCRVPLHVAFHNYVSCRRRLREAILRYEPVNIDVIHKDLVATGYRYNPKDLLKFMDRKCITVKTADNSSRNRKS